jgi:hypothetical protein
VLILLNAKENLPAPKPSPIADAFVKLAALEAAMNSGGRPRPYSCER